MVNKEAVVKKFEAMGARAIVNTHSNPDGVAMNILKDKKGSYFAITIGERVTAQVLDVQPKDRHLVFMTKTPAKRLGAKDLIAKYLGGHDERDWFVAAVPEKAGATTVVQAKASLQPPEVVADLKKKKVSGKERFARHNKAFRRQGEWFFRPVDVEVDEKMVRKDEPLSRGRGSKPHIAQFAFRKGGESVYVHRRYPDGVSLAQYEEIVQADKLHTGWQQMVRNAQVYVKGTIRHSDHKTIYLDKWHEVTMNEEHRALAMRHVTFLD